MRDIVLERWHARFHGLEMYMYFRLRVRAYGLEIPGARYDLYGRCPVCGAHIRTAYSHEWEPGLLVVTCGSHYCRAQRHEAAWQPQTALHEALDALAFQAGLVDPLPGDTFGYNRQESDDSLRERLKAHLQNPTIAVVVDTGTE